MSVSWKPSFHGYQSLLVEVTDSLSGHLTGGHKSALFCFFILALGHKGRQRR